MWWTSGASLGEQPELLSAAPGRGVPRAGWGVSAVRRVAADVWVRSVNPLSTGQRALVLSHHLESVIGRSYVTAHAALGLLDLPVGSFHPAPLTLWAQGRAHDRASQKAAQTVTLSPVEDRGDNAATRTVRSLRLRDVRLSPGLGLAPVPGPWGRLIAHPVEALVVAAPQLPLWRVVACLDALLSREISIDTRDLREWGGGATPGQRVVLPGESRPRGHLWILGPMTRAGVERALTELPTSHPGVEIVRQALTLAQESVASPMETILRLHLEQQGMPHPEVHHVVMQGTEVVRLSLAWPQAQAAVVYHSNAQGTATGSYGQREHHILHLKDQGWVVKEVSLEDITVPRRLEAVVQWVGQHSMVPQPTHV